MASNVCSWLQPALFSSFPFFARVIKSRQSEYAFCTSDSFFPERMGPGMTSFIPKENPMFAISRVRVWDPKNQLPERTKPTCADFGEPIHSRSRLVVTIIAHDDTKNRFLLPADRGLVHDSAHNLTVDDYQPAVVGREIRGQVLDSWVVSRIWLLFLVALAFYVDHYVRVAIRTHKEVEYLFARPQALRFPYCRGRDIYVQVGIREVGAYLGELFAVKKPVLGG